MTFRNSGMKARYKDIPAFIRYTIIILLFITIVLLIFSCESKSEQSPNNKLIPSVEAVQAHYGTLPLTERLTGLVTAKNQVGIYPEISAAIITVHVNNGDVVKKGQTLIRLRDREFQERLKQTKANYQIAVAQAKQAEARVKEVRAELKRAESLNEEGLTSSAELENIQTQAISAEANLDLAKARVEQAQATVEESEAELSETVIRAPVSGSVGNRNAEVGMLVNPGTRLFTLGQLENLKIEVVLTDRMLNYIEVGQRTEIFAEYLASGLVEAPLSRISPFLHPVAHTTVAEIDLKNPGGNLKPGMFVTVDVYYGESEQATLIPLSALYENPESGETGVYFIKDSLIHEPIGGTSSEKSITLTNPVSFEFVPVEVIARGRMSAGIRGVVEQDDWIVTLGQNLLGSESGNARVHTVNWGWIEELQNLQSQDLLKDVMKQQQVNQDRLPGNIQPGSN
jgi:HlyD family secretion protein